VELLLFLRIVEKHLIAQHLAKQLGEEQKVLREQATKLEEIIRGIIEKEG
jgi:hypothetical protein